MELDDSISKKLMYESIRYVSNKISSLPIDSDIKYYDCIGLIANVAKSVYKMERIRI